MKQTIGAVLILITTALSAQQVNLGIIADFGEDEKLRVDAFSRGLQEEIQKTLGASYQVILEDNDIIRTAWDPNMAAVSYETLSQRCDYIILLGMASTKAVLERNVFTKPTIALGIANVEVQGIPLNEDGASGISNFSYILISRNFEEEIKQFKALVDFKNLSLLVYEKSIQSADQEKAMSQVQEISESLGVSITPILVGENIQESLSNLPDSTDAVLLASVYEFNDLQIETIANHLNTRKIPSYSLISEHVEKGFLASVSADNGAKYIVRKLAIMIDDAQQGTDFSELSVNLDIKKQLFLNVNTARKIDYSPSFQAIFTAKLIGQYQGDANEIFSLKEIINKALEENLNIKISKKDLELSEQNVKNAKSNYLPTLDVQFQGLQINKESASELTGRSEKSINETGNIGQIIYSESIIANIQIQELLKEAQKFATKQEINNVVLDAYTYYFNVLFAKSNVTIQTENLDVLKKNLELAQVRTKIGSTSNSDVYRWEAEVANATQSVIQAQTNLILAKTQLNTYLNNTLPDEFEVEDVAINDDLFDFFSNNIIAREMNGPADIHKATAFLTVEAKENYPGRLQLNTNLSAIDRQLLMNKRLFYTPTIGLGASQTETLHRGGAASEITIPGNEFINSTWNIGLSVSYPIFDGTRRKIEKQRTLIQKNQLTMELENMDNNIGLSIQAGVIGVMTSQTNIHYSAITSENAWKNFIMTQDYYRQGSVSIVQLFDAQNTALQAKLSYVNSVYNYLMAFVSLENTIGYYSMLGSDAELQDFENKYQQFIENSTN
ncbi:MAG: TolC family protein [Cytophagales bacterium]|nr:TolC family protein [Cytophagales bacterium]